jgi:hypothetical protein
MKNNIWPKTLLGKLSVVLHAIFLIAVISSIVLVLVLGLLDFGDLWWDVTVPVLILASLTGLVTGIIAVAKKKERSVLVYVSIFVGVLMILFVLLHSLFIND